MLRYLFAMLPVVALTAVATSGVVGTQSAPLTAEEGRRLEEKLVQITDHDARGATTRQTLVLPAREINAYLRFQGATLLPEGVRNPLLTLAAAGRIDARAVVDLDAVSQAESRGLFDPLAYLSGELEVVASGTLHADDGVGRVAVESVSVGGVPVPRVVLDELVQYYTRSAEHPDGIDLDEPFPLPYRIEEVTVEIDRLTVVQ